MSTKNHVFLCSTQPQFPAPVGCFLLGQMEGLLPDDPTEITADTPAPRSDFVFFRLEHPIPKGVYGTDEDILEGVLASKHPKFPLLQSSGFLPPKSDAAMWPIDAILFKFNSPVHMEQGFFNVKAIHALESVLVCRSHREALEIMNSFK